MNRSFITPHSFILLSILIIVNSCATTKSFLGTRKIDKQVTKQGIFSEHFTGIAIFDLSTDSWIYQKNASKYFTPASNTKLITLFASLKVLGEKIPSIKYQLKNDTLLFSGMGDPTFLHPDFQNQPTFDFLNNQNDSTIIVYVSCEEPKKFGSGWAWDDYIYDFQPELSAFPIYGNIATINSLSDSINIYPPLFKESIEFNDKAEFPREKNFNYFLMKKETAYSKKQIPFITSPLLFTHLLSDTLNRKVLLNDSIKLNQNNTLFSVSSNHLYAIMLKRSDNFYAEQLLLLGSQMKGFGWRTDIYRNYIINKYLKDLPQPLKWKDGSGLSRYNLVTPISMVTLLKKIESEIGFEKIEQLFPVGGISGTIKKWYSADTPYVFAKTGTLSNNHSLSGFIKTNSGKLLAFSFMNNNYVRTNNDIKESMQYLLEFIRDNY